MGYGQEDNGGTLDLDMDAHPLRFRGKLAYAVGTIGDSLSFNAASFYLLYYLTSVAGIPAIHAGILVGLPAAFLFILDPFAGILSDRVQSRVGRRRVFIVTCGPVAAFCFFLRFYAPAGWSPSALFLYWFVVQIVFGVSATLTMVSYTALTAELSPSSNERTQIVGMQQILALVGTAIGSALTLPIVTVFGGGMSGFAQMAASYAIVIGMVFLTAFAVTSRRRRVLEQSSTLKDTALVLRRKPFWFQSGIWFLTSAASTVVNALLVFYLTYVLEIPELLPLVMLVVIAGAMVSVPLWNALSSRYDKRVVLILGDAAYAAALISLMFLSESTPTALWPVACLAGAGTASLSFLRIAMMTDLIAYDDACVGHSRAGNITGLLGLGNRGGGATGSLLVGWLLSLVGYVAGVPATPQLREGLRMAISLIPSGLLIAMIPLLVAYPLKRRSVAEAEQILRKRAGSMKEPS